MKKIRYAIEGIFLHALMLIFRLMPLDIASGFGGWVGRTIGPRMATSRKALTNIQSALPDLSNSEQRAAIKGMWDNLGRVMAEYPHLEKIARERVTFVDDHNIIPAIQNSDSDKNHIYITAHLANWEVAASSILLQHNITFNAIYREPNNPYVRDLLDKARTLNGKFKTFPKSTTGMREILKSLKAGENLGILIDQKYNEGIAAPFFGMDAMTSTAFAELSLKFDAPIVPGRVERLDGAHFRITIYPVIETKTENGTPRPIEDIVAQAHQYLEQWIAETPAQWLWLHKRWASVTAKHDQDNKNDNE